MIPVSRRYQYRPVALIKAALSYCLLVVSFYSPHCIAITTPPAYYTYEIINRFPHDVSAYTQGLLYHEGYLYESTGLWGQSTLRKVDPTTGRVLKIIDLDSGYFGEGLARIENRLIQLTWKSGQVFVYDLDSFQLLDTRRIDGDGWGLATMGKQLVQSNGSADLLIRDPATMEIVETLRVKKQGTPVTSLNELELVDGMIFANIYRSNQVVVIAPSTGKVTGVVDLGGLLEPADINNDTDVLNGIAYDAEGKRLFVTGKRWPWMFEIKLIPVH
jgi:glutamine cyclotransferase